MPEIEVLFFDVLGTVVDWRGSITAEVERFLRDHDLGHVAASDLADAWVGRYDAAADDIRTGQRAFVTLDVLNRETLDACLLGIGINPTWIPDGRLAELNRAWHRLRPWPDAVAGLSELRKRFIVAPLSDGHTRMLVNMAKFGALPWDTVPGADIFEAYKPMPDVYLGACHLLDVSPENAMLVAAHGYDLAGARQCGLKTAYVQRQNAADPSKADEGQPTEPWDLIAPDLEALAHQLRDAQQS